MAENEERDPDAIGHIAGKTKANAVRALQAADNVGYAQWRVRATRDGFDAPNAIVDEYNRLLEEEQAEAVAIAELEAEEQRKLAEQDQGQADPGAPVGDDSNPAGSDAGDGAAPASEDLPDETWTVKQLDSFAAERNIELAKNLNKPDKVAAITAALNKEK